MMIFLQLNDNTVSFFGSLFPSTAPVAGEGWDATAPPPAEGRVAPAGWEGASAVPAGVTPSDWE